MRRRVTVGHTENGSFVGAVHFDGGRVRIFPEISASTGAVSGSTRKCVVRSGRFGRSRLGCDSARPGSVPSRTSIFPKSPACIFFAPSRVRSLWRRRYGATMATADVVTGHDMNWHHVTINITTTTITIIAVVITNTEKCSSPQLSQSPSTIFISTRLRSYKGFFQPRPHNRHNRQQHVDSPKIPSSPVSSPRPAASALSAISSRVPRGK